MAPAGLKWFPSYSGFRVLFNGFQHLHYTNCSRVTDLLSKYPRGVTSGVINFQHAAHQAVRHFVCIDCPQAPAHPRSSQWLRFAVPGRWELWEAASKTSLWPAASRSSHWLGAVNRGHWELRGAELADGQHKQNVLQPASGLPL